MFKTKITYQCEFCDNYETETIYIEPKAKIQNPSLPEGWILLNDIIICNKHNIVVELKEDKESVLEKLNYLLNKINRLDSECTCQHNDLTIDMKKLIEELSLNKLKLKPIAASKDIDEDKLIERLTYANIDNIIYELLKKLGYEKLVFEIEKYYT